MLDLLRQSWFWPALAVVIGLPILLLILTELTAALSRRGHPAAVIVRFVRNFVVPAGALLVLISQVTVTASSFTWTRIIATVFGFLIILAVLNGVNAFLFRSAKPGTWRDRIPSIFTDILRLLLVIVGLAVLFALVWGADVGGLFTALGVSSVVIGLALQNAIGPVVSGLFLLFEQPFRLGDWLDAEGVRGRVVEVNWRAVHIETGTGIQIIPNGTLAGASFTNLSRTGNVFPVAVEMAFATDDPPEDVVALLRRVADGLPMRVQDVPSSARPIGAARYLVSIPVANPALEDDALGMYLSWLWYAARRSGLHLDGDLTDDWNSPERRHELLRSVASVLRLNQDELEGFLPKVRLERYAAGETIQIAGAVPDRSMVIASGAVLLTAAAPDGTELRIARIAEKDMLGLSAATREVSTMRALAITDVTIVSIGGADIAALGRRKPLLAKQIGQEMDNRRAALRAAIGERVRPQVLGPQAS